MEKARQRRDKTPSICCPVLEIEPLGERGWQVGGATARGGEPLNALPICRGPFKDYGEGNGLFGRYRGRWWGPGQARGSGKKGIIAKDYQMGRGGPEPQDPAHPGQDGSPSSSAAGASEHERRIRRRGKPGETVTGAGACTAATAGACLPGSATGTYRGRRTCGLRRDIMAEESLLTFEWLCEQEPGLRALYREIEALRDDPPPCSHQLWMRHYKPRLRRLVGWGAGRERVPDRVGEQLGLTETEEENAPLFLTLRDIVARYGEAGPRTGHPALRTPAAYDLAYETLLALLPPCWQCSLP